MQFYVHTWSLSCHISHQERSPIPLQPPQLEVWSRTDVPFWSSAHQIARSVAQRVCEPERFSSLLSLRLNVRNWKPLCLVHVAWWLVLAELSESWHWEAGARPHRPLVLGRGRGCPPWTVGNMVYNGAGFYDHCQKWAHICMQFVVIWPQIWRTHLSSLGDPDTTPHTTLYLTLYK